MRRTPLRRSATAPGRRTPRLAPRMTGLLTAAATALAGSVAMVALAAPAYADDQGGHRVTPGNFTGVGFDQCLAPDQAKMDRWLNFSPFLSAGIYISGKSRACREQPNLTPAWVGSQLRKGWRLLPITLGPQAWCNPRFPRYSDDVDIARDPGRNGRYVAARKQGQAEALDAISAAQQLGIAKGSTLWYDLEGFDLGNTTCRESSIAFVSGWSYKLKQQGWVSGAYSSAGSGIKMLDDARQNRPKAFVLPEYLWIARWDDQANTSTSYIPDAGWNPHRRVKQYQGGHDETWGNVTINIDRNWLDVGRGSVAGREHRCGGVRMDYGRYAPIGDAATRSGQIRTLQCLLKEKKAYAGPLDGAWSAETRAAADAWRTRRGFEKGTWTVSNWVAILGGGKRTTLKVGSAGHEVRRLQRALNAAGHRKGWGNGVFRDRETDAVRAWQRSVGLPATGIMANWMWGRLAHGRY